MRKFVTTNWTWQVKDFWQQPLHMLGGATLVMFPGLAFPSLLLLFVLISVVYGMWREYHQHSPVFIDVDSCFWTLGAVVAALACLP